MEYLKLLRNTVLVLAAAFVIFFVPVNENKASAKTAYSVEELKEVSSKYLGVRYSYGGTSAKGFDCSGYVRHVFKEMGITSLKRTSSEMYNQGTKVSKEDLEPG